MSGNGVASGSNDLDFRRRRTVMEKARAVHLSKQLQMRLQYARLKVEHGWQRQNLNEVENLYFHHSAMKSRPKPVQRVPTLRLPEPAQPTQSTSLSSSASKNAAGTPSAPANSASSGNAVDASSPTQDPPVPPTPVLPPSGLSQTLSPSTSQLSRPPSQPSRPSATSASETGRSMAGSSTTPAPGPAVAAELARLPTHPTQASSNFGPSTPTYQPLSRTATEVLSPFAPQSSTFSTFPPPSASSSFTSQSTFVSPSPFSPAVIPIPGMSSFPSNISSTQSLATYGPGPHPFTSSFTVTNGSFSSGQGPPQTFRPTKMFDIPTAPPPPPSSNGSGLMGSTSAPLTYDSFWNSHSSTNGWRKQLTSKTSSGSSASTLASNGSGSGSGGGVRS